MTRAIRRIPSRWTTTRWPRRSRCRFRRRLDPQAAGPLGHLPPEASAREEGGVGPGALLGLCRWHRRQREPPRFAGTPGRQVDRARFRGNPAPGPFHDVHCRLTGPVAAEVFHVFKGRDEAPPLGHRDRLPPSRRRTSRARAVRTSQRGRDIIQVAQTSFKPAPGRPGFRWAPEGNAPPTTHSSSAIRAAREHIYIEEQYMVPSDAYMAALIEAADNCERLIILLPSFLEVYFGDRKRGNFFKDLSRRGAIACSSAPPCVSPCSIPPDAPPARAASHCSPTSTAARTVCSSGHATRVPSGRFFVWANGELMYVTGVSRRDGPQQPAGEGTFGLARWKRHRRPLVREPAAAREGHGDHGCATHADLPAFQDHDGRRPVRRDRFHQHQPARLLP